MTLDRLLGDLAGQTVPGGCEDCDADQTVSQHHPGVWLLTVAHDDGCPILAAHQQTGG